MRINFKKYVLTLSLLISIVCNNYVFSKAEAVGDEYFKKIFKTAMLHIFYEEYDVALSYFKELLTERPDNANINCLMGVCYLNSPENQLLAIPYLEKAVLNTSVDHKDEYESEDATVFAHYYLALIYHIDQKYDKALNIYNEFSQYVPPYETDLKQELDYQVEVCDNAMEIKEKKIDVVVEKSPINSKYSSYSAQMSSQGLFYSSKFDNGQEKQNENSSHTAIYMISKTNNDWSEPQLISDMSTKANALFCQITADGNSMFMTSDISGNPDIYSRNMVEGIGWSKPLKLGNEINTKYDESYVTISFDGKIMYFVSNRKGGNGGKDIYKAELLHTGTWGNVENMGTNFNTEYDEEAPFITDDGKLLFFSSSGHKGIGGFDVFYSIYNEEEWSLPENIGMPINSVNDDTYFRYSEIEDIAYYSSAKKEDRFKTEIFQINNFSDYIDQFVYKIKSENNESVDDLVTENQNEESIIEENSTSLDDSLEDLFTDILEDGSTESVNDTLTEDPLEDLFSDIEGESLDAIDENIEIDVDPLEDLLSDIEEENNNSLKTNELVEEVIIDEDNSIVEEQPTQQQNRQFSTIKSAPSAFPNQNNQISPALQYYVQLGLGNMRKSYFHNIMDKLIICKNKKYQKLFLVGGTDTYKEAKKSKEKMMKKGYTDCWIRDIEKHPILCNN